MKVKIFTGEPWEQEKEINAWLAENPTITILEMQQSEGFAWCDDGYRGNVTITFRYE